MISKLPSAITAIFVSLLFFGCQNDKGGAGDGFYDGAAKDNSDGYNQRMYKNVPDADDYYKSSTGLQLIDTLQTRYTGDFAELTKEINASHAKLYVCYVTSELGDGATECEKREKPFLKRLCAAQNVTFVDFSDQIESRNGITFMPIDGHFNKKGAAVLASTMSGLIKSNTNYRTDASYPAASIPTLLGDDDPDVNKIVEDKKGLPYKLVTNHQGLRMDRPVEFPKKGQHVLLMGDSEIYLAGVDNPETLTGDLQHDFPDKTIVNASKWGYTIDDELSLWQQRAKYTEPDIVLLQVDGRSISNLFFSQKIKFHRPGKEIFKPTPLEQKYYNQQFK